MADKLADLQKRYAWFGEALSAARAEGSVSSQAVRFFIVEQPSLLYDENDELILDADGDPQWDPDAEPAYIARAQAWSFTGDPLTDPSTRTVAGTMDLSLQLLDHAERGMVLKMVCAQLSEDHDRELARATAH